jgi:hypothetical protein
MKDAKGRTIKVGDNIVAALTWARSPMLAFGTVVTVEEERVEVKHTARSYGRVPKRPTWLHFSERLVVLS